MCVHVCAALVATPDYSLTTASLQPQYISVQLLYNLSAPQSRQYSLSTASVQPQYSFCTASVNEMVYQVITIKQRSNAKIHYDNNQPALDEIYEFYWCPVGMLRLTLVFTPEAGPQHR